MQKFPKDFGIVGFNQVVIIRQDLDNLVHVFFDCRKVFVVDRNGCIDFVGQPLGWVLFRVLAAVLCVHSLFNAQCLLVNALATGDKKL